MNPEIINSVIFFALIFGGLTAVFIKKWRYARIISLIFILTAGAGMLYLAGRVLGSGPIEYGYAWQIADFPARLAFKIDYLSAVFVTLIGLLSICSAFYALGFLQVYQKESPGRYYLPFMLFVAGMVGVVTSSDFFYFLLFWEVMTLSSYLLVVYDNSSRSNLKAGYTYFLVTHITAVGLIVGAILLASRTGSFQFSGLPGLFQGMAAENPALLHVILALMFIGFGAKAGVFPFGFWMPAAYSAAPASASAVFSGVMSKMGVYGLLRVFVWLLPLSDTRATWGIIIATFGVLSMLVGNLRALGEEDDKRLLAQSSIGQMGYILMGIGIGLYFKETDPFLSMVAFIGALYHLVNHSLFKSLLFFNTGSVFYRTGSNDLNRVGGLIRLLPAACACGLIGSLAIAGIPPVNGFMSKWLLYQAAIFGGSKVPVFAFYGVIAIFISTVSLAAYLKYMGTAYLGVLPQEFKDQPSGQPWSMNAVQIMLAAGCILMGLFPGVPVRLFYQVLAGSFQSGQLPQAGSVLGSLAWGGSTTVQLKGSFILSYGPIFVLLALLTGLLISWGLSRISRTAVQPVELWNCGEDVDSDFVRYRAAAFYKPFLSHFSFLYRPVPWPRLKLPSGLSTILDVDRWLYFPLADGFMGVSRLFSRTHKGKFQVYLLWQLIGVVLVILGLVWMMGG